MIYPYDPEYSDANDAPLREQILDYLGEGGRLSRVALSSGIPFERRPQQVEMSQAVADALEASHHLVVEAGTGVGKSFAYLVPMILKAKKSGSPAVVSTHTIALQEQLIHKDIPFLKEKMGLDFRAVLVKGRSNYICLRRLKMVQSHQGYLFEDSAEAELAGIQAWADRTTDGTLQDIPKKPGHSVWDAVCAEAGNCLNTKCAEFKRCHLQRARAAIWDAHLLVVNHHILFSDLALRQSGVSILPEFRMVTIDEAHTIESAASEHLGIRLSLGMFEYWLRRLYVPDSGRGILGTLRAKAPAAVVRELWEAVADFFHDLPRAAGMPKKESLWAVKSPINVPCRIPALIQQLDGTLAVLQDTLDEKEDLQMEIKTLRRRGKTMAEMLAVFLSQRNTAHVYWLEHEGRHRLPAMFSAPVEVGPILKEIFFDTLSSAVLTSATLAVNGHLKYYRSRIGLAEEGCEVLCLGTPFNHEQQMRLYVVTNAPDPGNVSAFSEAVSKGIIRFSLKTNGRAFALFTSHDLLKKVVNMIRLPLHEAGLEVISQDQGEPRHKMLEKFKRDEGFVLCGLDSFWMGVDVPGAALSNVMITRLPFAMPGHPLTDARMQRIKDNGGIPFKDYSLPEAILKFRQGVGRLIRSATDEGIVVVFDSRIVNRSYGRIFLRSIPECPIEEIEL